MLTPTTAVLPAAFFATGVANVDGARVGGASLKAEEFLGIAKAYR